MPNSERTPRRKLFVKEYLVDQNGTRAAIAAGYAEKSAAVTASRLLRNAKVRFEIERELAERVKRLDITGDKVLQELALIGFANMQDYIQIASGEAYVDLSKLTREQAAAIQEITSETFVDGYEGSGEERKPVVVKRTKFKLADKRSALELLGKNLKLWTEKVEHSGATATKVILIGAKNEAAGGGGEAARN